MPHPSTHRNPQLPFGVAAGFSKTVAPNVYFGNRNSAVGVEPEVWYVTTYGYNGLDIVTSINYNGGKEVSYQYNKVGDLVKMVDWTGTTTFEVDLLNRITKTTDTKGNVVGYTYDATGNQTSVSYPDGTTATKTYDLLGQLKTVTETDGRTTTYTYDGMGRISKMEYPHGWVEDYHYDSIGQLLKVEDTDPTQKDMKQQKHVYEYDACGNMTYEYMRGNGTGEATVENTYTYDALHRVTSVHENYGNDNRSYAYDSLGNLTYETAQGNKSVDYKLNNLNQITSSSDDGWKTSTAYTYDKRGNLVQELYTKNNKQSVTGAYTYDETNKMVQGVNDIGESSEYLYNGLGALVTNTWIIKKNAYGYHDVQLSAVIEGETVVDADSGKKAKKEKKTAEEVTASPELNKTSTVVKEFVVDYTTETYEPLMEHEVGGLDYRYVYGNDRLSVNITGVENGSSKLIENGNQIRLYYHMDYLGTADYLTSPLTGKVESWTHYNEWGEITHNAVLKCGQRELDMVKRYATHDYDQVLGMYYAKARFYDAENRRVAAVDPILNPSQYSIKEYANEPMQLVQYLYVSNNPIINIDPQGENNTYYAAYWTQSAWALCALDGPVPVGDIIYVAGIGVCIAISNWDQITKLGSDTIRTLTSAGTTAIKSIKWVGGKVVNGLDWVGGKVQSAIDIVGNYFQSVVCSAQASIQTKIEKGESKVVAKVKAARNNFYNFFEIWFDIIGVPIVGRGLSRVQAVSRLRHGSNVITYFRSIAQSVANEAGGGRAMHHQKHGGAGYFNHFHIMNHANSAHIFYIV